MATDGVAAVDRALSILSSFDVNSPTLSLTELARRTGLYKSTLLRLAASLERANYLRRFEDGTFGIGPELLKLGELYQASFDLERYVMPILRRLADDTGESASFYVREGDLRVCLYRINSTAHRVLHYVTPGSRLELRTGAAGRILVAFTEPDLEGYEAERREWLALSHQDRKSDTAAIASPVFGPSGFIGALSLAGPRFRFDDQNIDEMKENVRGSARLLSEQLGATVVRGKSA
jgi:DNA-binding IclR family transcriptional regulator